MAPQAAHAFGENVQHWAREFPKTDFTRRSIKFSDVRADGAARNTITPIKTPRFVAVGQAKGIGDLEPVISVVVEFVARAYPLRILLWHELVNDTIAGKPVLVSYSPIGNAAAVFERRVAGQVVRFGNTGRLRHFNMLMYDTATQSWWQQYTGKAVIGARLGATLPRLAARVESLARFRERHPDGEVLVANDPKAWPYGETPFVRMDSTGGRGLEAYLLSAEVKPFERVVAIGNEAWTLKRLRDKGALERDGLYIGWEPGQNSVHDTKWIAFGRDVGNVVARRFDADIEEWVDVVHDVPFAFTFKAFHPGGTLYSW